MFFYLRIHTNDPERKGQHNSECNFPTGRPVRPLRTREFPSSLVVPSIIFSFLLLLFFLFNSFSLIPFLYVVRTKMANAHSMTHERSVQFKPIYDWSRRHSQLSEYKPFIQCWREGGHDGGQS